MEVLLKEIQSYQKIARDYLVVSIFVGGGTPTVLSRQQLLAMFEALSDTFSISEHAEITVEMNPGTVTTEKLEALRSAGVNRISIGLQSVNDRELKMLGRIHTYEDFLQTYEMARKMGFENINVDLISAIPFQTTESWRHTINTILSLDPVPEHLSAYSLIIEEGTPFFERYGDGMYEEELPDEDSERIMYQDTKKILEEHGYHRYEISNYAKAGYECRHNLGYWERKEYLGIGLGAASLLEKRRFNQTSDLAEYLQKGEWMIRYRDLDELFSHFRDHEIAVEELTRQDEMEEFMFLGLRKIEGVSTEDFYQAFGQKIEGVYGKVLEQFTKEKLLESDGIRYKLTDKGLDVSNYVMSEFLL